MQMHIQSTEGCVPTKSSDRMVRTVVTKSEPLRFTRPRRVPGIAQFSMSLSSWPETWATEWGLSPASAKGKCWRVRQLAMAFPWESGFVLGEWVGLDRGAE